MSKSNKEELANQAYQLAHESEMRFGCCPQCVLAAVKDTVGYVTDETIKASHGLSGGGGLSGLGACGALTGGLLAWSCKRGRAREKFDKGKFIGNFQSGKQLVERFEQQFGGVTCRHLQQRFTGRTYDMWDAKEYAAFEKARDQQCAHATALVSKWVVEML